VLRLLTVSDQRVEKSGECPERNDDGIEGRYCPETCRRA